MSKQPLEHRPDEQKTGLTMYKKLLSSAFLTFLFSFLLIVTNILFANDNLDRLLTKNDAAEDIELYFEIIDQQHGNPYQFISRSEFRELIDQTITELPNVITFKDFDILLSKLNNKIRCGHTVVSLDTETLKAANDQAQFFPYPIRIIDDSYFIDFEDGNLPLGAELISINGNPVQSMTEELSELTVTDGFSATKPIRDIESRFGYYYFLKYGASRVFEVAFKTPSGENLTQTIEGIEGNKMLANNYYRPVYKLNERYYHFTHLDAIDSLQTLVLTLNTFQANPDWFFKQLASRYNEESNEFDFENLIIDLRLNEGGDRRILNFLYEFMGGGQLVDPSKTFVRTQDIELADYLVAINGANSSTDVVENAGSYLKEHFNLAEANGYAGTTQNWHDQFDLGIHWEGKAFNGNIYVLTSGKTFSAAADLARILSSMDNVTLVGEETGGGHNGRTANMLLNYSLPNTQTMLQVPVIYEEFINVSNNSEGRGTFPDHLVTQSYSDLLNKKDSAFEFTLQLISQSPSFGSH